MMNKKNLLFLCFVFGILPLLGYGLMSWQTATASAEGRPTPGCYNVFIPAISGISAPVFNPQSAPANQGGGPGPQGLCVAAFPDFNNDGYADLVVGVNQEDIEIGGNYEDAGAVHVIYGSAFGLEALAAQAVIDDQVWHRGVDGLNNITMSDGDSFGNALAMADFNGDGFDDLAIGASGTIVDGHDNAGAVQVLYGSVDGLTTAMTQTWHQDSPGINGVPEQDDRYGFSLATGDFDGDGFGDLAVGIYNEPVNDIARAGAVNIIYGSPVGLKATLIGVGGHHDELLTQASFELFTSPQFNDHFGHTLAAADFDGDGHTDIAVGTPYEDFAGDLDNAGVVQIYHGSPAGIVDPTVSALSPRQISANTPGVDNHQEANELFGLTLTTGDFDGNGYVDLAIGTPYETHGAGAGAIQFAGAVNIVYSGEFGLDASTGAPIFHQGIAGMDSDPEAYEFFAFALAAADFNKDGFTDLVAGVPYDQIFDIPIGSAHIIYGTPAGLSTSGNEQMFDPDTPEDNDSFGFAVSALDTNGDSYIELAVGAFGDDPVDVVPANVGSVFVFHSDADGVDLTNNQNWYQGHNGVNSNPELNDHFGGRLP